MIDFIFVLELPNYMQFESTSDAFHMLFSFC